jgi:micrococcal nuclease
MKRIFLIFLLVVILAFVIRKIFYYERGKVLNVIDGDTFKLENGRIVRLIGVDAPEKHEPCFNESKEVLRRLLENKTVVMKGTRKKDRYGRLLRYVHLNSIFINLLIVRLGYAKVNLEPGEKYYEIFKNAEEKAKELKRCIWRFT